MSLLGLCCHLTDCSLPQTRAMIESGHGIMISVKRKSLQKELHVRGVLHRMSVLLVTMNDELSLLPVSDKYDQFDWIGAL
jgi:hypothetical protein